MQAKQKRASKKPAADSAGVDFKYGLNSNAREVYLVGDFNNWDHKAHRMTRRGGVFQKSLDLPAGEYQYKFLVDGQWQTDPSASAQVPNAFGTLNSVIRVRGKS